MNKAYTITIIGAGAAGIGFGTTLKSLGFSDFIILEKGTIGDSFKKWPKQTRFITPSFTTNGFGFPDLNAIFPDTSPAFTFHQEHLSGEQYANYLTGVAQYYELPIQEHTPVTEITPNEVNNGYEIITANEIIATKYVIMATGEFQSPNKATIKGSELGLHYSEITDFDQFSGREYHVIGGNESGIDLATRLFFNGKKVAIYTNHSSIGSTNPDPSIQLAPVTNEKFNLANRYRENIKIHENYRLTRINKDGEVYIMTFANGEKVVSTTPPLLATGFQPIIKSAFPTFFDFHENNKPLLTPHDESTRAKNIFVVGPSVQQEKAIFCYIYKFRQRFVPIIEQIAQREQHPLDPNKLQWFKDNSMYLINIDKCGVNCDC